MRTALMQVQADEIARIAHQVKGLSASLGVQQLAGVCADIESLALRGELGPVGYLIERASACLAQGVAALQEQAAKLQSLQSKP